MNPIFPGADRPPETPRFGEARVITSAEGRKVYMIVDRIHPASQAKGIVLYFHGNGEVVEDLDYVLPFFQTVSFHTVLVEYPGFGNAPGAPSETTLFQTSLDAYAWVKKELPDLPVMAAGWSLGSSVAAYLASEKKVAGLLMLSAMTSMKEVIKRLIPFLPDFILKGNLFETTRFLPKVSVPTALVHGVEDDLVPVQMGRRLKEILGDRALLLEVSGATHNDLFFRAKDAIQSEVLRLAGKK